jgi:hypothetical protein
MQKGLWLPGIVDRDISVFDVQPFTATYINLVADGRKQRSMLNYSYEDKGNDIKFDSILQ